MSGTLKQTDNGFVYIDVSNDVVDGLFSMVDNDKNDDDLVKPPYNQKKYNQLGAHISVINDDELDDDIKELGEEFYFKLSDVKSTNPEGWDEVKKVYFVEVESPELEKLRQKYDLPKRLNGHQFHITIGVVKS